MTRFFLSACAAALLILTSACQSREKTVFPAVRGQVIDISTGVSIDEAWVSSDRTSETIQVDSEGRFALASIISKDTSIPLPASGVYRDTATLEAQADGARAYGPADFISTGVDALSEVTLFLIGWEAPLSQGGVPDSCELTDQEVYTLQFIGSLDTAVIADQLSRDKEYAFAMETWLSRTVPRHCDIPLPKQLAWTADMEAIFSKLED